MRCGLRFASLMTLMTQNRSVRDSDTCHSNPRPSLDSQIDFPFPPQSFRISALDWPFIRPIACAYARDLWEACAGEGLSEYHEGGRWRSGS